MLVNMHGVPSRHRMAVHARFEDAPSPRFYRVETEDAGYDFDALSHMHVRDAVGLRYAARRFSMDEIEGFLTDALSHLH